MHVKIGKNSKSVSEIKNEKTFNGFKTYIALRMH